MKISIQKTDIAAIVALSGHFDPEDEDQLRGALEALVDRGHTNIVVNMSAISSINSQGLSVLINAKKRSAENGGNVKIAELRSTIRELFELTRLHTIFEIFETTQEAADSFR